MLNQSSSYAVELTGEEQQLIRACVLMSARQLEDLEQPGTAIPAIAWLAECISGLNHGQLSTAHIDSICASLEAMSRLMRADRNLPMVQREAAMTQAAWIQQKLQRGHLG